MNDLYAQAMAYINEMSLPEPDSLKLVDTDHLHRIEITYLRPASDIPGPEWTPTNSGTHEFAEYSVGLVLVSLYAERSKVTA